MALPERFEPWYLLVVAAFLVGSGASLLGSGTGGFVLVIGLTAVLSGLLWAFAVYVFVGTFRNYVTSYADSGGSLWNPRFLAPFVVGALAGGVVYVTRPIEGKPTTELVVGALSAGFWAFVIAMIVVLTASYVIAGYREAQ
ncbi:hypothetical protein B4589_007805 [Halolamina sp. CBA1230]|uniref:hypothetical protein n=1 Tax=Halolamina sp. CBA1230 TaxID=1853690 RepID=UPI0009A13FCC|nr:hypothetical protein [Halolamina sp. CBA1230]QKY20287.1 hypothetical protein B4589_007805 [Halolamina sp. CBA1230]